MSIPNPILFLLNSSFPEYSGGRENWLYHMANRLEARGHEVHILTIGPNGNQATHYNLRNGIHLHRVFPFYFTTIGRAATSGPLRFLRTFAVVPQFYYFLLNFLRKSKCKPIVIGLDTVVTPLAVRGLLSKMYFICASKGPHAEVIAAEFPWIGSWVKKLEIQAYMLSDELWSNGYDMQDYIRCQGFDSVMIGNGVDITRATTECNVPEEFRARLDTFKVVSIGSLLDIKCISEAIAAMGIVYKMTPNAKIEIFFVGKGNPQKYMNERDKLGLHSSVHFLGPRKDVFPYMQHADGLLCLSGGGGLSMAALESLASRTPVIAWDTPVYKQMIINNKTGFLVPFRNIELLANMILHVLNIDHDTRVQIGNDALKSVKKFDWENITTNITARLNHIIQNL